MATIMPEDSALDTAKSARHVVIKTTLLKSVGQEVNQLLVPTIETKSHLNIDE